MFIIQMLRSTILIALAVAAAPAIAQSWSPTRNVEIIAGSAAGGAQDRTARAMQRILTERKIVATPVTVVNRPGGGGAISFAYLNQHAGDAHYVAVSSPTLLSNHIAGSSPLHYNDFASLALLFSEYIVIATRTESPIKSGRELMDKLRQDPGAISTAVATARGGMQHAAIGLLAKAAGADVRRLKVVVFNAGAESITAVLGGHVDIVSTAAANAAAQVQAGRLRILGVAAPQRLEGLFASAPTWQEQGYPVSASNWRSVLGPRGLTAAQTDYWDATLSRLTQSPEWLDDVRKNHWTPHYLGSRAARAYFDSEYASLKSILSDLVPR